jgi:hypothetical protein
MEIRWNEMYYSCGYKNKQAAENARLNGISEGLISEYGTRVVTYKTKFLTLRYAIAEKVY